MILWGIIFALLGYLIGSISPAYFLGRILRGIDIREHGTKNAGTTNVKRTLGLGPAIIAGLYDVTKGVLVAWLAYYITGQEMIAYFTGYAAIVGHCFPFYLKFEGGQGIATAVGLMLTSLVILFVQNFIPIESLITLALLTLVILVITRKSELVALVVLPGLAYLVIQNYGWQPLPTFTVSLIFYIFGINILEAVSQKLFALKPETKKEIIAWRVIARPLSLVFPIFYLHSSQKWALVLVGAIVLPLLVLDLIRLAHSGINLYFFQKAVFFFKKKEAKRFSSMTLFLISIFFIILIFPRDIAIVAIIYLIFGDIFAKFFGRQYGRIKVFSRTFEGSLSYFTACVVIGYFMLSYTELTPTIVILGAAGATVAELLPWQIDDNLSAGLSSASVMYLWAKFV